MIENFEIKNLKEELKLFENKDFKEIFWHTSSHILAQAVKRLFPEVQLAIGPAIENGFYYDFDIDTPFSPEDIEKIEKEMNKIVDERLEIKRVEMSSQEAKKLMEEKQEIYKIELIEALESKGENISLYSQGEFIDLCAGPHLPNTSYVKSIKLLQSTGAYWHGDAKNKMLTRIYGISFPKNSMLKDYLDKLEEAKRRDHRKIGKDLELFALLDEGKGFPFFLPKGMVIRNILEDFWREEHKKAGYVEIKTPVILNEDLWKRSGHWAHYKDNMYTTKIDEQEHAIKPMNCPGGMLVFKTKLHSYRDLPIRMAELGLVHRHELSGALHGLMRVRCFTQDDAHIFMTESQIESEIIGVMNLIDNFYSTFGFKYYIELSTRPSDSMGSDEQWEAATTALKNALDKTNKKYKINEGDGAFYGPKIDFHLEDSIGRTWQCGTVQLDFQMPEKFDLSYISETGEKQRPVMIHRVVFGSIERFIGILTEHFAGDFPLWIAPLQCKILPISQAHHEAAHKIFKNLELAGLRAELDERNEKIGYKIREAQLQKIPYMIIIGDKEITENKISVRSKKLGDLGSISLEDFINKISEEIKNKSF
ncbi:MAG: threonine--tRNA ligase [Oscillospiraceae bacterium]|nr:threonine--tRNA ligase [Oscillospiraceae bacterium]